MEERGGGAHREVKQNAAWLNLSSRTGGYWVTCRQTVQKREEDCNPLKGWGNESVTLLCQSPRPSCNNQSTGFSSKPTTQSAAPFRPCWDCDLNINAGTISLLHRKGPESHHFHTATNAVLLHDLKMKQFRLSLAFRVLHVLFFFYVFAYLFTGKILINQEE